MLSSLKYIGSTSPGKPTVIFIPGGMATSPLVFEGIGEMISWQSVRIDWSKSGVSGDVMDIGNRVAAFIQEHELGPVILAGYSAGGFIAMQAALAEGMKQVAGLLLSNTGPCTIGHGDPHLHERVKREWFDEKFYEQFLMRCFAFELDDNMKRRMIDYAREVDKDLVYQSTRSLREYDLRPRLKEITCPVVIAHGILDQTRTKVHVEMLTEGIADTEVYFLHGGHTIMVEDREGYAYGLNRLIGRIEKELI